MNKISYQRLFFVIGALSLISSTYLFLEHNYAQDLVHYGFNSSLYDDSGLTTIQNPFIQVLVDSVISFFKF